MRRGRLTCAGSFLLFLVLSSSCVLVTQTIKTGGEQKLAANPPPLPPKDGAHVIVFALDGAVPAQLMNVIREGRAPHISALLGKDRGDGLFEHGYEAPHALSVLPSSTIADWTSIFTGKAPAYNGITGDEWFERETMQFYAPVPVSTTDIADDTKTVEDDLVGRQIQGPTLYEKLGARSYVSLLSVHRGATYYTTVSPGSFGEMITHLIKGALNGYNPEKSLSAAIDRASADKVVETINQHGVPDLQVVYFPGIDIFTHTTEDPLNAQERYLQYVTDPAVGKVLDEYKRQGITRNLYVIFISDHAHIPTINEERNEVGVGAGTPFVALKKAGFRVRRPALSLPDGDDDFQAVFAYQGFMAYAYLANRSTCIHDGDRCDWKQPPRFEEDVIPALRALYRSNKFGKPVAGLKGRIDLIFSRIPVGPGETALPYEVFDGRYLVPIHEYLKKHPRPDLVDLETRMRWLSAGPYGNRAGDILLLAPACLNVPIEKRYYFADIDHFTWHGSACEQDSHIPFILARTDGSGERMRDMITGLSSHGTISERQLTPLVGILLSESVARNATRVPGANPEKERTKPATTAGL